MRASALEKTRISIKVEVGELKCEFDEFKDHVNKTHEKLQHLFQNATPSLENCFDEKIRTTQKYLEAKIKKAQVIFFKCNVSNNQPKYVTCYGAAFAIL